MANREAAGAHILSATRVALSTARTLTGEPITTKVKNTVYDKVQEKRAQHLAQTKQGSCDLIIKDGTLEWREASATSLKYKGFTKEEMDKKLLCFELTHRAGAYFNERPVRHSPELLGMILPNGEKIVNTCPLCDKDTQANNGTQHLDTAHHLFHECQRCDDLRKNLRQNIKTTLLTHGLNIFEAAEGTGRTMGGTILLHRTSTNEPQAYTQD